MDAIETVIRRCLAVEINPRAWTKAVAVYSDYDQLCVTMARVGERISRGGGSVLLHTVVSPPYYVLVVGWHGVPSIPPIRCMDILDSDLQQRKALKVVVVPAP